MKKIIIYGLLLIALALALILISTIGKEKTGTDKAKINLETTIDKPNQLSIKEKEEGEQELQQSEIDKIQEAEGLLLEEEYLSENQKKFLEVAKKQIGVSSSLVGNHPKTGFTNLGYIYYCLEQSGLIYTLQSLEVLFSSSRPTDMRTIGDLIFFKDENGNLQHVAIYIGNNQMLHCTNKVEITEITGYWMEHFLTYRQICV